MGKCMEGTEYRTIFFSTDLLNKRFARLHARRRVVQDRHQNLYIPISHARATLRAAWLFKSGNYQQYSCSYSFIDNDNSSVALATGALVWLASPSAFVPRTTRGKPVSPAPKGPGTYVGGQLRSERDHSGVWPNVGARHAFRGLQLRQDSRMLLPE